MTPATADPVVAPQAPRVIAYVSAATLAQLLDCSPTTIMEWTKLGRLPRPVRIGGSNRWKWSEVEKRLNCGPSEPVDPILEAARGGNSAT